MVEQAFDDLRMGSDHREFQGRATIIRLSVHVRAGSDERLDYWKRKAIGCREVQRCEFRMIPNVRVGAVAHEQPNEINPLRNGKGGGACRVHNAVEGSPILIIERSIRRAALIQRCFKMVDVSALEHVIDFFR